MKYRLFLSRVCTGVICISLSAALFAADKQLKQYQTFSWQTIPNARKYEVAVEKEQADGTWQPEQKEITRINHLEMLLYPGSYRVSISAFNVLNKKASESPWVAFIILDETEPFLFSDMFGKKGAKSIGTLYLSPSASPAAQPAEPAASDAVPDDVPPADPPNAVHIKGKNIFFPETSFYFVPVTPDGSNPDELVSYSAARHEVPLTVIRRDRDHDEVVATYDTEQMDTGCYRFEVRNPGNMTASLEVNVYSGKQPELLAGTFKYDKRYKAYTAELPRSSDGRLIVRGKNLEYNTQYALVPSEGIPYPFASILPKVVVPLKVESFSAVPDKPGLTEVQLSYDTETIATGYYRLTASNQKGAEGALPMLITAVMPPEKQSQVTTIKSKYVRRKNIIEFTINGSKLGSDAVAVLISPYSEKDKTNKRQRLSLVDFSDNKKKLFLDTASGGLVEAGIYALLIETEGSSVIQYITVDKKYSSKITEVSEEENDAMFLGPEDRELTEEMMNLEPQAVFTKIPLGDTDWSVEGSGCHMSFYTDDSGEEHTVVNSEIYGTWDYAFIENTDPETVPLCAKGDSIRFKITAKSTIMYWTMQLITIDDDSKRCTYTCPLYENVTKEKTKDGKCYIFDVPYSFFKPADKASQKTAFDPAHLHSIAFYLPFGSYSYHANPDMEIYDMEVYDSNALPTYLKKKNPVLFTNWQFRLLAPQSVIKGNANDQMYLGLGCTTIDFNWLSTEIIASMGIDDQRFDGQTSLRLSLPWKYFKPYCGAGIGYTSADEWYVPCYAGLRLAQVIDFRYICRLHDITNSYGFEGMYFTDEYSIGLTMWLRPQKIMRVKRK